MPQSMFRIKLFLNYFVYLLTAKSKKGYGIHSPFLYRLSGAVFNDKRSFNEFKDIRKIRSSYSSNQEVLKIEEFGAGSRVFANNGRTVSRIAKIASTKPKYGELLFRLVRFFQPEHLVEFGTSLGIGTLYMAKAAPGARLVTIEGCKELARKSKAMFRQQGLNNVHVIEGDFIEVLGSDDVFESKVDFVYFDGGHTKEMTLYLFEQMVQMSKPSAIFVFDDIRWSSGMEEAWKRITNDPRVTLSLDLFHLGITFFRKEMAKQHLLIKY
jgi:predicted O-methyltransferase YrrM